MRLRRTIVVVLSFSAIAAACSTDGSAEAAEGPTYTDGDPMDLSERPREPDCPDPEIYPELAWINSSICEYGTRILAEWESVAYGTRPPDPSCKDAIAEGFTEKESIEQAQARYDRICSEGRRRLAEWNPKDASSPQVSETVERTAFALERSDDTGNINESVKQLEEDISALEESNAALVATVSELIENNAQLRTNQGEIIDALFGVQNEFSRNTEIYGIDGSVDQLDKDLGKVVDYVNCLTNQYLTCTPPLLGY